MTRFRLIGALALCLASIDVVSAQQPSKFLDPQPGDNELTVAFKTCKRDHWVIAPLSSSSTSPTRAVGWEKGWEHCAAIEAAYQQSAEAAEAKKKADQVEVDRQQTKALADKLKK